MFKRGSPIFTFCWAEKELTCEKGANMSGQLYVGEEVKVYALPLKMGEITRLFIVDNFYKNNIKTKDAQQKRTHINM